MKNKKSKFGNRIRYQESGHIKKQDGKVFSLELPAFDNTSYPPILTAEEDIAIKELYATNPKLQQYPALKYEYGTMDFHENEAWIQTYSGRRFNPTNPIQDAIVIQDIAHALSNICRFTGHSLAAYSVAQHSVLVSYICNYENRLQALLHDSSEAYIQDVSSPLKRTPEFAAYRSVEAKLQEAIYKRFDLPIIEQPDVKMADLLLLATEARDLMGHLRSDWVNKYDPLPFKIVPLSHQDAKNLFMKRFYELTNSSVAYENYLINENKR